MSTKIQLSHTKTTRKSVRVEVMIQNDHKSLLQVDGAFPAYISSLTHG